MMNLPLSASLTLDEVMMMDRAGLADLWEGVFGSPPPDKTHIDMLRQAVGWQIQAQESGGLDSGTRRMLMRGSVDLALSGGTKLVRQWQGVSHQVTVLDRGFEYEGHVYRSLSAVARRITGTSWNGLTFFGVKK